MNKSENINELATALHQAQSEMSGAKKSSNNPYFKSKYADLYEIINCAKGPLASNGLSFSQFPVSDAGSAGVETVIMHNSGQWISNSFMLPCSKCDPQGMGSAITYARRYGLQSALGIPSEDDDGNAATSPTLSKEEAISLLSKADSMEKLQAAWSSIAKHTICQHEDVIGMKDARKEELK